MKKTKQAFVHTGYGQERSGFTRAKKALGQNFLKNKNILNKIVKAGEVSNKDIILEIGPGKGALTKILLENARQVVAVEKDNQLFNLLQEKFAEEVQSGSLVLVHDDILKLEPGTYGLKPHSYKIIANIPYNITGAILKKFLTETSQPNMMVLMIQHEVAKRILARDGKESILSISIKAHGKPEMIMKVDKRFFSPSPKVNSAVIKINNINRKMFEDNKLNEEKFWEIVKTGFSHKRKKLSSNLKSVIKLTKETEDLVRNKRAEDLKLEDWITLGG